MWNFWPRFYVTECLTTLFFTPLSISAVGSSPVLPLTFVAQGLRYACSQLTQRCIFFITSVVIICPPDLQQKKIYPRTGHEGPEWEYDLSAR